MICRNRIAAALFRARRVGVLLLPLILATTSLVRAQGYPEKQIEIINSFAPGGTNDLNLRALQSVGDRAFGKTVIQTFKPGGGGISGTTEVAHSTPDGYKLLVVTSGELTAGPNLTKTAYNLDSFAYIGRISSIPYGFVVRKSAPWKDFAAFKAATVADPDKVLMGTTPRGGAFLAARAVIERAGLKVTIVPYSGSGPYVTAVLGGHVAAAIAPVTSLESHIGAGTLRLLAVTGSKRLSDHPDVPAFSELGIDAPFALWVGLVAPKGIPSDRLTYLRDHLAKITKNPDYLNATKKLGISVDYAPADEFEKQVRTENTAFHVLVKELGLAPK
jgi:putative tricarboxylic transport membrane protein